MLRVFQSFISNLMVLNGGDEGCRVFCSLMGANLLMDFIN